ncbi:MAG: tetratricopeptide repeat protein [Pseudomonadota bacterium]
MSFKSVLLAVSACVFLAACESDEDKAERFFQSAQTLFAAGDVDRAIVELRNVFANDEGHKEALLLFAQIQKDRGRNRQAVASYLRVAEEFPEEYIAVVNLAELAAFMQSWEEAERHGRAAFALNPEDISARAVKLVLDYRQALLDRDTVARRAVFEDAKVLIEEKPESLILRNVLIDGYTWIEDYEAAVVQVDASIDLDPDHRPFHFSKLSILGQIGDEAAIEAHLRDMAERFPDDEDIKATMIRFLVAAGDLDKAEAFFRGIADPTSDELGPYLAFVRFITEVKGEAAAIAEIDAVMDTAATPEVLKSLRAGLLFDSGQRDQAIAEMEAILADPQGGLDPSDLKVTLAQMLLSNGNEVGARRRVEEVLEANSVNVEALKMQANWLIEADKGDEAVSALRTALVEAPDDVQALTILATAYERVGSRELARDTLSQAVAASGNAPEPSLRFASVLANEDRLRPAERVLVDALREAPLNVQLLSALGQIYLATQDFDRAAGVGRRLSEIATPAAMEQERRLRVGILAGQQQTDELLATLEAMAASDDASLQATITLIRTRLANGEPDVALQLAQDAVTAAPENPAARTTLAATLAATGDIDGAISIYREMIADGSGGADIWRLLTVTLFQAGQVDAGQAAMNDAISAFPDDPQLMWMQASSLEAEGDIDGAIGVYERMYEANSASLVVANNLASLLATWRSDDADAVERAFFIARRLRGTDVPAFQDTYGWILHLRGSSEEAIDYLEPAARALSQDPVVQFHLGTALLAVERYEDAATQFEAVLALAGEDNILPQVALARSQLAEIRSVVAPDATNGNENAE